MSPPHPEDLEVLLILGKGSTIYLYPQAKIDMKIDMKYSISVSALCPWSSL